MLTKLVAVLLVGQLLLSAGAQPTLGLREERHDAVSEAASLSARRVYAPYNVPASEAVVFWLGRVTSSENYTDVRIRYTDENLLLSFGIMDRFLWYDATPSSTSLTAWDSVSLYLRQGGSTGEAPDANSYRFDAQLDWWEQDRGRFQAAFRGDGAQWVAAPLAFTTATGWNGNAPNDEQDDRGWMLHYAIPFTALGLDGPPALGTVWGLGVAVHDRDTADGPPLADEVWPETLDPVRPVTWGQLAFGLEPAYDAGAVLPGGTTVVREGMGGAEVADADVGGSSTCGDLAASDFFSNWGDLNWAGKEFVNVQHVDPISEWPCFSKYYVTFPLDSLPTGKVVLSATLTLYQFGNAGEGWDPGPQPAFIEALTVGQSWVEDTLTWNNAPRAGDYVAGTWVDPLEETPPWPGVPRQWDVSRAVADAYAAGEPLRLVLYSPDQAFHSGRYFFSSDIGGDGEGRPTVAVTWGEPALGLSKSVWPASVVTGDVITYTLGLHGDGGPLTLTDTLPSGLGMPTIVAWNGTSVAPTYDDGTGRVSWRDTVPVGQLVTLTYSARVTVQTRAVLRNTAVLANAEGAVHSASAVTIVNAYRVLLPLVVRSD